MTKVTTSSSTIPYFVLRIDLNSNDCENTTESSSDPTNVATTTTTASSQTVQSSSSSSSLHRAKALFTVPDNLAMTLIVHPILCCGSSFHLLLDDVDTGALSPSPTTMEPTSHPNSSNKSNPIVSSKISKTTTTFLYTMFDSIDPDQTAYEISVRIAIRLQNVRDTILELQQRQQQIGNGGGGGGGTTTHHCIDETASIIRTATQQQKDWANDLL